MRTKNKLFTATILSAALICTFSSALNAADINITENYISLNTSDNGWQEVSDKNTLHTFTNGTDIITVLKYNDYESLPSPAKVDDKYQAVCQTFFSVGDGIYVVTGSAVKKENISQVKDIMDSLTYPEVSGGEMEVPCLTDANCEEEAASSYISNEQSDSCNTDGESYYWNTATDQENENTSSEDTDGFYEEIFDSNLNCE